MNWLREKWGWLVYWHFGGRRRCQVEKRRRMALREEARQLYLKTSMGPWHYMVYEDRLRYSLPLEEQAE